MPSITKLSLEALKSIYDARMKEDFPPDELRPFSSMQALTQQNSYASFGYDEDGNIMAYACFARVKDSPAAMLDYYAVSKQSRGSGIGSKFLAAFPAFLKPLGVQHVILEVESVEKAKDAVQAEIRRRRIAFYEKNGCRRTQVRSLLYGVYYDVMVLSMSGGAETNQTIMQQLRDTYRVILKPIVKNEADFLQKAKVWLDEA